VVTLRTFPRVVHKVRDTVPIACFENEKVI